MDSKNKRKSNNKKSHNIDKNPNDIMKHRQSTSSDVDDEVMDLDAIVDEAIIIYDNTELVDNNNVGSSNNKRTKEENDDSNDKMVTIKEEKKTKKRKKEEKKK